VIDIGDDDAKNDVSMASQHDEIDALEAQLAEITGEREKVTRR
jgi:hypothetical protein